MSQLEFIEFCYSNMFHRSTDSIVISFRGSIRFDESLVALKDFDYSCSLRYKRPHMSKSDDVM